MAELTPAQQKRKARIIKLRKLITQHEKEIKACPHDVKHLESGFMYDEETCSICGKTFGLY